MNELSPPLPRQPRPRFRPAVLPLLVWLSLSPALDAGPTPPTAKPDAPALPPEQAAFFETRIRPLLANRCYECHSASSPRLKGELLLDSREGVLHGGQSGPAVVPHSPDRSLLIKAVRYLDPDLQMPPKGKKLSDTEIADLITWVQMGAPDPRTRTTPAPRADTRQFWAFRPPERPTPPALPPTASGSTHPIDAFVAASLQKAGLAPSAAADKRTLIRRVYFDLIGLPPTPGEVKSFLEDRSPQAYERVVDHLLSLPQYGERWGRHWLDVARYSDTKGEIKRLRDTPLYPFAWTYRDYVIKAFNDDKPYDLFIVEQIAADRIQTGRDNSSLAALGFLTLGERFQNNENDIINDRIDVVTKGFLGLTVTCARCHDHAFDPIPTRDYYSLHGIFASSHEPKVLPLLGPDPTLHPDYSDFYHQRTGLQKELDELPPPFRKTDPQARRELLRQRIELQNRIDALELTHPAAPARANVLIDRPNPKDSPVFLRGEAENKGPVVPRRFLECLSGPGRKSFTAGSGRLELARAIASRNNPLTARVMVNRIWQHHFGEGLVATPDDFGTMGSRPTHPELLDFLACYFMDHGWSIKQMHRLILLSNTYQQSSASNPHHAEIDPMNHLLWRQNLRRLEFEPLRDSLLALGGNLDTNLYGRPVPLALAKGRSFRAQLVLEPSHRPQDVGYTSRRTVYGYVDRSDLPEVFNHFDFASPQMENGHRHLTTVPQQALYLMNSPLVVEQARNLIRRPDVAACPTDESKLQQLYEIIYQRLPTPEELGLGLRFLAEAASPVDHAAPGLAAAPQQPGRIRPAQPTRAKRERSPATRNAGARRLQPLDAWAEYAHALLLANETAFVH